MKKIIYKCDQMKYFSTKMILLFSNLPDKVLIKLQSSSLVNRKIHTNVSKLKRLKYSYLWVCNIEVNMAIYQTNNVALKQRMQQYHITFKWQSQIKFTRKPLVLI